MRKLEKEEGGEMSGTRRGKEGKREENWGKVKGVKGRGGKG